MMCDITGGPDLKELEALLVQHSSRKRKIGSFSAGSNITGITIAAERMDGKPLSYYLHVIMQLCAE